MMAKKDQAAAPPNLSIVQGAVASAKPAPKVGRTRSSSAENDSPELPFLPPGCPVEPLGMLGQTFYYLDERKQLIGLDPSKHGKGYVIALFGRQSRLVHEFWPRYSDKTGKDGKPIVTGWKSEIAAEMLMGACAMCDLFDPQGKVRGTGAHRDDDGELVLHCGDEIYITGVHPGYVKPGKIGRYVYPAGQSRPRPDPQVQDSSAAEFLLMKLHAWNWQRPVVDPMLLLGWVGCAILGGALDWRPHAWITGGTATGKSTLQKLIRAIFDSAALTTGNATEAGLRQLLKQQTLPVLFDELEAAEDNRKSTAVVELARVASSGDQVLKGGQNHEGAEFTVRSCFLFSSINIPPMPVQDKNRMAILELEQIEPGKAAPTIDLEELHLLGRRLRRRLVDQWHRIDELVERYKTALGAKGHSGRSGDQFGTLLAIADVLLYDVADRQDVLDRVDELTDPDVRIAEWAHRLKADTLEEKSTEIPDEDEAVLRLATSFLQGRGGDEPRPIARHIREALDPNKEEAQARLENFGLRIVEIRWNESGEPGGHKPSPGKDPEELYLAVANNHVALAKIFSETRWSNGTWAQSFKRVTWRGKDKDGAPLERRSVRRVKIRFARTTAIWSTAIPLAAILDLGREE
jgi:hypothetical protein